MFKNICIIGAGNIGSRHLQGLAKVKQPLNIFVFDPYDDSLGLAKKRFEEISNNSKHQIKYSSILKKLPDNIDVAIIATNSNIRFQVTNNLLNKTSVKYIIFEKILFDKKLDYQKMAKLLQKRKIKAWVNCSRRTMPFYKDLKKEFTGKKINYFVFGSQWNLASNSIHLIDHIAYLTDCYDFEIGTKSLDTKLLVSKHKAFIELSGTLDVYFEDGSIGNFICYPTGNIPQIMQIFSEKFRLLTLETQGKSYISKFNNNWQWVIKKTPMLYQSEMTNQLVSDILNKGGCDLTPFDLSSKLHLKLLDPLLQFINKISKKKYISYPFT